MGYSSIAENSYQNCRPWRRQLKEGFCGKISKQVLWRMRRRCLTWTILLCANVVGTIFVMKDRISVLFCVRARDMGKLRLLHKQQIHESDSDETVSCLLKIENWVTWPSQFSQVYSLIYGEGVYHCGNIFTLCSLCSLQTFRTVNSL